MTRAETLQRMDQAAREDRERFLAAADTMRFQPKYQDRLEEIEAVKQAWRDMTDIADYPNVDFPLPVPDWFPKVKLYSAWKKDAYLEEESRRENNGNG